ARPRGRVRSGQCRPRIGAGPPRSRVRHARARHELHRPLQGARRRDAGRPGRCRRESHGSRTLMVGLARKTLIYEWRKFLPAALAVAFSGLLLLMMTALMFGIFSSGGVYVSRSE